MGAFPHLCLGITVFCSPIFPPEKDLARIEIPAADWDLTGAGLTGLLVSGGFMHSLRGPAGHQQARPRRMGSKRIRWARWKLAAKTIAMTVCFLVPATLAWGLTAPGEPARGRLAVRPIPTAMGLGERMYRQGVLPSGQPMQSFVLRDVPVGGTAFTCVSCHLRSGTGSYEDGVVTLPTHGPALFQPSYRNLRKLTPLEREQRLLASVPSRPAYNDETLATALRVGLDPTGREFNPIMPRYNLSDADMAILLRYLHALSAAPSPGIDATTLRLATVITEEVSLEDRQTMLAPLDAFVSFHNRLPRSFNHWMYRSKSGREMIQEFRQLSLARWILRGPANTWRKQLEDYYRQEPVFALVGGLSYGTWQSIHAFSERRQIPCILPLTDFPVVSQSDWYTLYFSRGFYQEGEAAARHLANLLEPSFNKKIVNLTLNTPESALLSAGFRKTWQELDRRPARNFTLGRLNPAGAKRLRNLILREKPAVLLLWTGPQAFDALRDIAALPGAPAIIFMSSGYLKTRFWELPDSVRSSTFLTYPYRHPEEETKYLQNTNTTIRDAALLGNPGRIATRTHSLIQVLNRGITEMERDFYRDNLLDRISMLPDQILPDFERLSFGPGQRYASKGCYIMQLSSGASPVLIKKSGWVVQ